MISLESYCNSKTIEMISQENYPCSRMTERSPRKKILHNSYDDRDDLLEKLYRRQYDIPKICHNKMIEATSKKSQENCSFNRMAETISQGKIITTVTH